MFKDRAPIGRNAFVRPGFAGMLLPVLCATYLPQANAGTFNWGEAIDGTWSLNASVGTNWRAANPDEDLISVGNGGTAGTSHDDGNLNFSKGETFSTLAKAVGELQLKAGDFGVFFRGKGWYDYELKEHGVSHGHVPNNYQKGAKLNDKDFDDLSKFSGVALLDAYAFYDGQVGDNPYSIKIGNQVVNWGESLFVPGINQFGTVDLSAARRPGATVKEILLPIPQISGTFGITDTLSLEAFYQFRWRNTILDGCGTYWAGADLINCSDQHTLVPAGAAANLYGDTALFNDQVGGQPGVPPGVTNYRMGNAGDQKPKDSGQFGVATRYYFAPLAAEFGIYFANYHQRAQAISVANRANDPASFWNGARAIQYAWDWSAENIKVTGLSASSAIAGWSVFGETSYTKDFPVQINGVDLLRGALGAGPMASLATTIMTNGGLFTGYDRKDKAQVQISTLKVFPRVLFAESMSLIGEVAYQNWKGVGSSPGSRRYGRAFVYGFAETETIPCANTGNTVADYCKHDGFFTNDAFGYRAQIELSYPDVLFGINVKPRVFWQHDVKGYSADQVFVEDRQVLGLAARFDYLYRYYADFGFTKYNRDATYDLFHDRDFYSAVVGINF